jgi:hypothetical protein
MSVFWVGPLFYVSVIKPWFLIRRPYRVAEERKERGDTHTLVMQPDGHPGDVSSRPVKRDWSLARIWLFRHLNPDHPPPIDRADSDANDQDYT